MFHKTSLRLTGVYLTIIMVIGVSFSVAIYSISTREFDRGFRRQDELINRFPLDNVPPSGFQRQFIESRQTAAMEAKARILSQLIFANITMLILGGGLSYFLARRTLEPIEEAHKSLERFTADASHELRTPIAAMKSEIEVALLQPKLKISEAKEVLKSNIEELDRLTALTSGLLSIARLEDGSLEIKEQELEPIIKSAISKTETLANAKNITFVTAFSSKKIIVKIDQVSLLETLMILLDNAIKFSKKDSKVELIARQKKGTVVVSVIDHGSGISAEDLPHVFERFYRADTSRSQQITKGYGLGLAIAKQLIERQNGTITITSKPKQSTTATITLPS